TKPRSPALVLLAAFIATLILSACETTTSTTRALPTYEPPLAKNDFQNVRTTAYTHTESDHTQYGARNALGGELHAAGPAIHRAENVRRAGTISDSDDVEVINISNTDAKLQPFSMQETKKARRVTTTTTRKSKPTTTRGRKRAAAASKPRK